MNTPKFLNLNALYTFGQICLTRKSQKQCEQELSDESFSRPLSLVPAVSYGQMMPKVPYHPPVTGAIFAYQDIVTGLTAKKKTQPKQEKERNKRQKPKPESKESLFRIEVQSFKIRVTNTLYEFWANPRLRIGLILVLLIAPLSKFFYLFFPKDGFGLYLVQTDYFVIPNIIEGSHWYFYTMYWFFFSISEFLTPLLTTIGIFFLFPKNYYPAYLCGVPVGYYFALLINRIGSTSNEQFHTPVALSFILVAILFAVFMFYMSDKMLFKTNHRKRAIEARILGLINMPGMSWSDKEELLKKEAKEALKAKNELFNRAG